MQRVLSVITVIDTPTPAGWINQLISRLEARDCVRLTVLVQDAGNGLADPRDAGTPDHAAGSISSNPVHKSARRSMPERLADKLMRQLIDKPLFPANPWLRETLATAETTPVLTAQNSSAAVAQCDVLIKLTRAELPDALWPPAAVPVWDAHLETLDARIEEALLQRDPLNWVHLWAHHRTHEGSEPDSVTSHRVASHALPRQSYSLTDLCRAAWFCLPSLIDSRINWLARSGDPLSVEYTGSEPLAGRIIDPEVQAAHARANTLSQQGYGPTAISGTRKLGRTLRLWWCQSLERVRHHFWYEQWQLGFRNDGPDALFHSSSDDDALGEFENSNRLNALANGQVSDFITIDSPDKTWWADPHLYRHNDDLYVFFEEMQIEDKYGHLSVARLTDEGRVEDVMKILDDGQHLSYPFVFTDNKEIYMIPETASLQNVQLYRAENFPQQWVKVMDLLSGVNLADSTVHFDGERWWMFTTGMSHRSVDERDELHLYHAETVTGPWHAHPMNPVVTGVDRARMAGSIIRDGSRLYRPSQFGALRYGHGINLHRIDTLDLQTYSETTIGRLLPDAESQWLGCHSTSYLDGVTVVDRVNRQRR